MFKVTIFIKQQHIKYTELVELEIEFLHLKKKGFQDSEQISIKLERPLLAKLQSAAHFAPPPPPAPCNEIRTGNKTAVHTNSIQCSAGMAVVCTF